ncbi:MAG: acyltransferase domain [Actinomycetota bacterium]
MADVTRSIRAVTSPFGARSRVRAQWLLLASALTVLAGVLVAWALSRAAARTDVVAAARPVAVGAEIVTDDLTVVAVAVDDAVTGLVPAGSIDDLVGRVATVPVDAGSLIVAGMWATGAELGDDERAVGALLGLGRLPEQLAAGGAALAVSIDGGDAATGEPLAPALPVTVRVLAVRRLDTGDTSLVLAVPVADAPAVARLAATDRLALVGVPTTSTDEEDR